MVTELKRIYEGCQPQTFQLSWRQRLSVNIVCKRYLDIIIINFHYCHVSSSQVVTSGGLSKKHLFSIPAWICSHFSSSHYFTPSCHSFFSLLLTHPYTLCSAAPLTLSHSQMSVLTKIYTRVAIHNMCALQSCKTPGRLNLPCGLIFFFSTCIFYMDIFSQFK